MKTRTYSFTADDTTHLLRLDQAIALAIEDISREKARKLVQIGAVWVNGKRVQVQSRKVKHSDEVQVYIGREGYEKRYEIQQGNILYEDEWLLFYRKEPGVPTQGIISDNYNNIYAGLLRYVKKAAPRPYLGLHHRLDIDTSGVMLFTKSNKINRSIHYQIKTRKVEKTYVALAHGTPGFDTRTVTTYISKKDGKYLCTSDGPGKSAVTTFTMRKQIGDYASIEALLHTGRTHQIRLQLAYLGLPIVGDGMYGAPDTPGVSRTMLHAQSLTVFHPLQKKNMTITADLFDDMKQLLA